MEKDKWGSWIINKSYNPTMLAEALCKLEGFTYAPSEGIGKGAMPVKMTGERCP